MKLPHIIAEAANNEWGDDDQIEMAIEECAELIVVLRHLQRGRAAMQAVYSEVADVDNMIQQLRWMFGDGPIDAEQRNKLERLAGRLGVEFKEE